MLRLILVNLRSIRVDLLSSLPSSESEEEESPLSLPSLPEKQETILFPLYDFFNNIICYWNETDSSNKFSILSENWKTNSLHSDLF